MKLMIFFFATLILSVLNPTQAAAQSTDPDRERAKAVWEEAIQAKGGRERLHSIRNFLISSSVDVWTQRGSGETQTERLYVGPAKAWIYRYTPGFDVSLDAIVIDSHRNFCSVTLAPKSNGVPERSNCLVETPIQYLFQDPIIYLMETSWLQPQLIGARTEGKGKKQLDVIETRVGQTPVDFYLDPKTRLPIKIVTDWYGGVTQTTGQLGSMIVELRNYVDIDGIKMPTKVTRQPTPKDSDPVGEPSRLDTERATYQFNVTYNPKIFESPISKTAKRRDWKP